MTTQGNSPGAAGSTWARRRAVALGLLLASLAAVGGVAAWQWCKAAPPAPPDVDLTGADPAVKSVIESARTELLLTPRSADAWGSLGMELAAHGFYSESVPCFAEARRLNPTEPRWPYFQGVALELRDPDAAIPPLRRAVELSRSGSDAPRLRLAEALLGQGQSDEAEALFREVMTHDPDNPTAHLGLGRLAYERDDWQDSLTHLDRAAASPLTQKRARTLLTEVYRRRDDLVAAERERRLGEDLPPDPDPPDPMLESLGRLQVGRPARLSHASTLLRQDRVMEAVSLLQELVRDYPDSASAWLGLGRALIQQERYRAAEPALREAARLDPARVEVQFYLGVALFQLGRTRDAADFFRRAVQMRPDYALAQYNLGQCLKAQGDRGGAIAAFSEAVRYKPHYAQAHADLGELLALDGRRELALQHLRLAVELEPADAGAKTLLEKYKP
jgi:tetratricopeptide (TPR) repeat protein